MDESSAPAAHSSDAELIAATASGDAAAFDGLRERHTAAARNLATVLAADPAEAEAIVSETFGRVGDVLRNGGGPRVVLRPYLFTAVRWTAHRRRADRPETSTSPAEPDFQEPLFTDPAIGDLVRSPLNQAFMSLPELWRAVLWHSAIEQADPAQTAEILGLEPDDLAGLAAEALTGLRRAYESHRLPGAADDLDDPGRALRGVVAPIFLGAAAAAYLSAAEVKIGGLRWLRSGPARSGRERRPRRVLAAASVLLIAIAGTGLALAAASSQHAEAQLPAAAPAGSFSPAPGSPLAPGRPANRSSHGPAGRSHARKATPPRPRRPSPSPSPRPSPSPTSSPSPRPSPSPSPCQPHHHRCHHPPFT